MVSATIKSSVKIRAVKEMATTCTNSDSKSSRAPYIRIPPGQGGEAHKVGNTLCSKISLYQFLQLHTEHVIAYYENLPSIFLITLIFLKGGYLLYFVHVK